VAAPLEASSLSFVTLSHPETMALTLLSHPETPPRE